jgi:hypothetical protein
MTSPEQIVRALAAADPTDWIDGGAYCGVCGGGPPIGRPMAEPMRVADHMADCPWRLSVEWVAAQIIEDPEGRTGDYFRHPDRNEVAWRLRGREAGGQQRYVLERDDGGATLTVLPETFAEFVAERGQ